MFIIGILKHLLCSYKKHKYYLKKLGPENYKQKSVKNTFMETVTSRYNITFMGWENHPIK
jgi:hypothetical protein